MVQQYRQPTLDYCIEAAVVAMQAERWNTAERWMRLASDIIVSWLGTGQEH